MTQLLLLAFLAQWQPQTSHSSASLRGVHAVNSQVAWASGTEGTVLKTEDGGNTWQTVPVAGAQALDFRGVRAPDLENAYLLSSGEGAKSRIYKTTDGGLHWTLQFTNPDAKGFFDAIAFWDTRHGIVLGDPVDGHFVLVTTNDGGNTWKRSAVNVPALGEEGAFAASNTCLVVRGSREAWFGTGAGRVFHSLDRGRTWRAVNTPVRHDTKSAGIFSLAFTPKGSGVAVGGNYSKPAEDTHNIALSGREWKEPASRPSGYRSAVAFVTGTRQALAVGTTGTDGSADGGRTWKHLDNTGYNALSFTSAGDRPGAGWAVGANGRIALYQPNLYQPKYQRTN